MIVLQVQMLLAAIAAILPLAPPPMRARAAELIDIAGRALAIGEAAAGELAAVRAEVEALAAAGKRLQAEDFDTALARVRAASAAFRRALETAAP